MLQKTPVAPTPDYTAIKQKQQATWASGDYAIIGTTIQIVGENVCEAVKLQAGETVLDVAAGNGNATLAAARRFAAVTSTDYVPELLKRGKERADAERLNVTFQVADAEALPFRDGSFDVALSTFGVMFAPNHEKCASELSRVIRKGGRIGLANWTPGGFIGQLFKTIGKYFPPVPGVSPGALWGTDDHLKMLFPGHRIESTARNFTFRYRSPEHWLEVFRTFYGPMHKAFAALDSEKGAALEADVLELLRKHNQGGPSALAVPSEYLETVVTKK